MIQPVQHGARIMGLEPVGQSGAIDHQHGQAEATGGDQLRLRAGAAGILAEDEVDAMVLHQPHVAIGIEWAAIDQQMMVGQRGRDHWCVDEAQQIEMLRLGSEGIGMHPAERQHDAAGGAIQRSDSSGDVGHMGPLVALFRAPLGARQGDEGDAGLSRGHDGIAAHHSGEGVSGVDQMGDALVAHIGGQSLRAAKAADAHRHRLRPGIVDPARIAERRLLAAFGQQAGQRARFGGSAQNQDVAHG